MVPTGWGREVITMLELTTRCDCEPDCCGPDCC